MRKWQMAALLGGAVAVQAVAQQPTPNGPPPMRAPETRADAEAAVRAQFARMDTNGDGAISRDEFDATRAAMQAEHGPPPADGAGAPPARHGGGMSGMGMGGHWFDRVDADHDGKVTLAEAQSAAMSVFDMVDADHDGTISPQERETARAMMRALHPHGGE